MTAFSVIEYGSIPCGGGPGCIPLHLANRLAAVAQVSSLAGAEEGGVLEHRRHDLRARGVVGVVAAEGCSLEILPKIEVDANEDSPQGRGQIRRRLVHMLSVALDLRIDTGLMTELSWQQETLLEILIGIFCDKLTECVRRGMPRRYTLEESDLPALRGTLVLRRQLTRFAANPSRLACRFDELSEDIAINRIMKASVARLFRMSRSVANLQKLRELAFVYGEIATVPVTALRWDDVVLDRTNSAWHDLLGMARLFLRNRYQTTHSGSGNGTALLFEMNVLFEEYIGKLVKRALSGTGLRASLQGGRRSCLTEIDTGREAFQTKPDILIWEGPEIVQIIDTKWKRVSTRIDSLKQGVSQADVYQMMAYAHLYEVPRLTLLYPHHRLLGDREGVQASFRISGRETVLETASIDVADGLEIEARLKDLILTSSTAVRRDNREGAVVPQCMAY